MPPDVLDGGIVVALAGAAGALELIGRQPEHAGLLVRSSPGRKYVVVNMLAGLSAYVAALLLDVHFREPERVILILTCGLAAITVLRSSPVTRGDFAGPARALKKLQEAYTAELNAAVGVRNAERADELVNGLKWKDDREALGAMCLTIAGRDTSEDQARMAKRIAEAAATDLNEDLCLFGFAVWLRPEFGDEVLEAAAAKVRAVKARSGEPPR